MSTPTVDVGHDLRAGQSVLIDPQDIGGGPLSCTLGEDPRDGYVVIIPDPFILHVESLMIPAL